MSEINIDVLAERIKNIEKETEQMKSWSDNNFNTIYNKIENLIDKMDAGFKGVNKMIIAFFSTIIGALLCTAVIFIVTKLGGTP